MKIIKGVGERILPRWLRDELRPVLAFAGAGAALSAGSLVLAARAWAELRERLSLAESIGALAVGAYLAGYGCWHAPHIARFAIPAAAVAWCTAAWYVAPPSDQPAEKAPEAETEHPVERPHQEVYEATLDWIRQQIADRQGVHLRDLLAHAQKHGMFEALEVSELRSHLERRGFPVRNRVRVRGLGVTVGIHRDDLPPLPEASPESGDPTPPDSELHAV
jgi:hypothetical protein